MNRAAISLLISCIDMGLACPQVPSIIRSSTKLVQITVIAHGREGRTRFRNTIGFLKFFAEVISFAKEIYTLGFYLSGPPDNQFHKLSISTTKTGVHLRYRPGYWDPAARPETAGEVDRQLEAGLDSPFTAGEIQLQAGLKMESSTRALITLFIDPKYLLLSHQGDQWTGKISVIYRQRTPKATCTPFLRSTCR